MIFNVLLPKLGETMDAATVEKWHKAEGESVQKGEVLLEITTDKATLEVESPSSGVVRKILASKGVTLPVNTVIALLGAKDNLLPANLNELVAAATGKPQIKPAIALSAASATKSAALEKEEPMISAPAGEISASPRARKLAEESKVLLKFLKGTGPGGRIVEKDITDYIARRDTAHVTPVAIAVAYERGIDVTRVKGTGPGGKVTKEDVLAAPVAAVAPRRKKIELTAMRRIVAERMTKSKREAPHFYLMMDVDMTAAAKLRADLNAKGKVRIGFHDLIIRACAMAFLENPAMNVAWVGDAIEQKGEINIGLAVALDDGLIVPVVRNADKLGLAATAEVSARLIEKARSKRLTPDEYEGGSLTISNLGMYDVENFFPVINPGESAILGVGRIAEKPVVVKGGICVRTVMGCSLAADHRAVDGAIAAKFLKRVKDILENPAQLA